MKNKLNFTRVVLTVFCILAVCMSLYYIYNFIYVTPRSEFAVQIECEDKVSVKGYFVRDESVVASSGSKYYDIIVSGGDRISRNGIVANVYSTDSAARIQAEIRDLQSKIDEFDSIVSTASKYQEDISYSSEIKSSAVNIPLSLSHRDVNSAFDAASDFVTSVIKSKIALGEITNYSSRLKQYEAQMSELKSQTSSAVKYIRSPVSGYFSQKVDGIEDELNIAMVDKIDADVFANVEQICSKTEETHDAIGKVVKGSDWRVCFKATSSKFDNVKTGSTLYIRLPSVTEDKIKCTVVDINFDGDDVYVVLQSNMVTGELISQRICDVDVIIDSYSGLRIDKNAIRKIDGEDGVYIKSNGIVRFRKVEVLYFSNTYVVVKYNPLDSSGVQAFDEVIVRGSDLYDRKVLG